MVHQLASSITVMLLPVKESDAGSSPALPATLGASSNWTGYGPLKAVMRDRGPLPLPCPCTRPRLRTVGTVMEVQMGVRPSPWAPRVLNKRHDKIPKDSVYIGRPSKWGNPFVIGRDGTREEVIAKYERWLSETGKIADLEELRGRDLVCWCSPLPCHGDVLLRLANRA